MKKRRGIFFQVLLSFALFASGLALAMAISGFLAARGFSLELLEKQSAILLELFIQAEAQARRDDAPGVQTDQLAAALGFEFLVGKQLPEKWTRLENGFYLEPDNSFARIRHEDGIAYALSGSLRARDAILKDMGAAFLLCAAMGLAAALFLAIFLSRRIAGPIHALARAVRQSDSPDAGPLPAECAMPDNEVGFLAGTIRNYQRSARERIRLEKVFTGAVSHELRTPLTVISQGLELLEPQCAGDRQAAQIVERLSRTCAGMAATLDALLGLARGERGAPSRLDLKKTLLDVLAELGMTPDHGLDGWRSPQAQDSATGARIRIEGAPEEAWGERRLAAAVIRNLVENAIRHCDGQDIHAQFKADSLLIINKGAFKTPQAESGLGLSIARRACAHMGWRLCQTGGDNKTVFAVSFTLARDKEETQADAAP